MEYNEQYKNAVEDKTAKEMVSEIKTEWQPNETIVGELLEISDVHFPETESTVNGYLFSTEDGLIQFTMGKGVDMQAGDKMKKGNVYACRFIMKKDISRGRTVNIFHVIDCEKVKEDGTSEKPKKTG